MSEPGEFPTQPNQNSLSQCLGEELLSSDTIGHDVVQPTPDPSSDEPFEKPKDPWME